MPLDIAAIVAGISTIPAVIAALKKAVSSLKEKTKEEAAILPIEGQVQEINNKLNTIKDGAWSINAYFELYGNALDLYTTGDDFTKSILRAPEGTRDLLAETNYYSLLQKFDVGIAPFLSTYSGYVDTNDEGEIRIHINQLRELLGQGKAHLVGKNYKKLETIINELTRISNILRGMARGRLLSLTMELQKVGGT